MSKVNLTFFLIIVSLFYGCDFVNSARNKINYFLVGSPDLEMSDEAVKEIEEQKKRMEQLQEIRKKNDVLSPKQQVFHLLETYSKYPDSILLEKIVEIIKTDPKMWSGGDERFINLLMLLSDEMQNGNETVMKFLFSLYILWEDGVSKNLVGDLLSFGFISNTEVFIRMYFLNFNDESCDLSSRVPPGVIDRTEFVMKKREALRSAEWNKIEGVNLLSRLEQFVSKCLNQK